MALAIKLLYCGTIGNSSAAVYTVPASKSALISSISLFNPTTAQGVNVEVDPASAAAGWANYKLCAANTSLASGGTLPIPNEITLGAGDAIVAWAQTTAASIQMIINGVERDV